MPTAQLGNLATVRMGATLRGRDATRPDPAGSYRLVQISDLKDDGTFRTLEFTRVSSRETVPHSVLLRTGDILFPNRGTRTTAVVFEEANEPTFVGAQFFVIRPIQKKIAPSYLAWVLRTANAVAYFDSHRRGTNVLTLQKSTVENFEVPLPALERQHEIAEIDRLQHEATRLEARLASLRGTLLEQSLLNQARNA